MEPYLESLHVLPEHRSTGVGELLMREIASAWQARGHTTLTLWVLEGNKRAQAFYQRLGGTPTGTQQVNWTQNAVNEHLYRWDDLSALTKQPTSD